MKWKIADTLIRVLLALVFTAASLGKLTSNSGVVAQFADYGFPNGFQLVIGIIELAGAGLLLIPKLSLYGIMLLTVIVIGAACTHLVHDPVTELIRPLVFGVTLGVAWLLGRKLRSASDASTD